MLDGLASLSSLHVLVVDSDLQHVHLVRQRLHAVDASLRVTGVTKLRAALDVLRAKHVSCVLTELQLPDAQGAQIVHALRSALPIVPVIVLTANGSEELAVAAMKLGAADYVRKDAPGILTTVVREAMGRAVVAAIEAEPSAGTAGIVADVAGHDFVATSGRMRDVLALVARAAPSRVPVLLEGETGTGKELLARAIHTRGPRPHAPLVVQNCAALTETLLESELFGHVRGAFTGAERDRRGLFAEAGDGTVFLDEIGEAPPAVQAKLLRVLQHGEVKAVGADRPYAVRARIVAATNRTLSAEVEAGRFRSDLYYRLAVFPISIPPLRHRSVDVAVLAQRFLERFQRLERRETAGFAPETLQALAAYPWPGNVRELEHEIHRVVLTVANDQRIRPHHLRAPIRDAASHARPAESLRTMMRFVELGLIRDRIFRLPTKTAAARSLGITREALYGKLRRLEGSDRRR